MSVVISGTDGITLPTGDPAIGLAPGTKMMFVQTAAPTGWTKDTTHDNQALRVVSGTASTGGSVAFTTAFASKSVAGTVGNTTLTTAQIPSHTHNTPTLFRGAEGAPAGATYFTPARNSLDPTVVWTTTSAGSSDSHNHSFTGTAIDMAVQYVDVIIATKD